jgi:hypothetical protein
MSSRGITVGANHVMVVSCFKHLLAMIEEQDLIDNIITEPIMKLDVEEYEGFALDGA